jgi:ankyrin repeat protein
MGADNEAKDIGRKTALRRAAERRHEAEALLLLKTGPNVEAEVSTIDYPPSTFVIKDLNIRRKLRESTPISLRAYHHERRIPHNRSHYAC